MYFAIETGSEQSTLFLFAALQTYVRYLENKQKDLAYWFQLEKIWNPPISVRVGNSYLLALDPDEMSIVRLSVTFMSYQIILIGNLW